MTGFYVKSTACMFSVKYIVERAMFYLIQTFRVAFQCVDVVILCVLNKNICQFRLVSNYNNNTFKSFLAWYLFIPNELCKMSRYSVCGYNNRIKQGLHFSFLWMPFVERYFFFHFNLIFNSIVSWGKSGLKTE